MSDLVERLRNAAKLAEKKYVTNSPELFTLGADRIEALESENAMQSKIIARLQKRNRGRLPSRHEPKRRTTLNRSHGDDNGR